MTALLKVDVDGPVVRLETRYDPALAVRLGQLPGRRFNRARGEWTAPARRATLAALGDLVDELGEGAELTARARRRIERARPGRITSEPAGGFRLRFPFRPRLLEAVRELPERSFDRRDRSWTVPPTRAGALALLALLEDGSFVADDPTRARISRRAAAIRSRDGTTSDLPVGRPARAAPEPHWRHVTRGPVFEANRGRQVFVAGVGWCVMVRVDPGRRKRRGGGASAERANAQR